MSNKKITIHYTQRSVEREEALYYTHRVLGSIAYVIVADEKRSKFNAKTPSVCILVIVKVPRHINSCA